MQMMAGHFTAVDVYDGNVLVVLCAPGFVAGGVDIDLLEVERDLAGDTLDYITRGVA